MCWLVRFWDQRSRSQQAMIRKRGEYVYSFWPPIFLSGGTTPTYFVPFGEVWLRSVCWPPYATPGIEAEWRICGGWVKWPSYLKHLWTKVREILRKHRESFAVFVAVPRLSRLSYNVSFREYSPLKFHCKVVEKIKGIPQISDMHFQIAFTCELVAGFPWVPFSELRE